MLHNNASASTRFLNFVVGILISPFWFASIFLEKIQESNHGYLSKSFLRSLEKDLLADTTLLLPSTSNRKYASLLLKRLTKFYLPSSAETVSSLDKYFHLLTEVQKVRGLKIFGEAFWSNDVDTRIIGAVALSHHIESVPKRERVYLVNKLFEFSKELIEVDEKHREKVNGMCLEMRDTSYELASTLFIMGSMYVDSIAQILGKIFPYLSDELKSKSLHILRVELRWLGNEISIVKAFNEIHEILPEDSIEIVTRALENMCRGFGLDLSKLPVSKAALTVIKKLWKRQVVFLLNQFENLPDDSDEKELLASKIRRILGEMPSEDVEWISSNQDIAKQLKLHSQFSSTARITKDLPSIGGSSKIPESNEASDSEIVIQEVDPVEEVIIYDPTFANQKPSF